MISAFSHHRNCRRRRRVVARQGDCLALLDKVPDRSVDLVLCDLPYGVLDLPWDKRVALGPLWDHYRRVARPRTAIVLFATQPYASDVIGSNPKWFRYELIWDKKFCTGFGNAHRAPMRRHENILVFSREPARYYPQGLKRVDHRVQARTLAGGQQAPDRFRQAQEAIRRALIS